MKKSKVSPEIKVNSSKLKCDSKALDESKARAEAKIKPELSVIVPVYNEEKALPAFIEMLGEPLDKVEVIFSDGGSSDKTQAIIENSPYLLCTKASGRAAQMNAAAAEAASERLFFLHCDSKLNFKAVCQEIIEIKEREFWGCLKLQFDNQSLIYKIGAFFSNLRASCRKIVFGDQGIFISRDLFESVERFPDLPLMEDYQFSLNMRKKNFKPIILDRRIETSARRFEEGGALKTAFEMHYLRHLYRKGEDILKIKEKYKDMR